MEIKRMNWLGLAGGVTTLILVVLSLAYASPWWQLTVAQGVGQADVSPLSFSVNLLGTSITAPIILFLNLACQLSLISSAIALLLYSIVPDRDYSKNLLNFAYKKPLFVTVGFLASLFVATYLVGMLLRVGIPLAGSTTVTLDVGVISITAPIATGFTWVFGLAVVASVLCIAARFYHRRIGPAPITTPAVPVVSEPSQTPKTSSSAEQSHG